jgi:hypothetical protein
MFCGLLISFDPKASDPVPYKVTAYGDNDATAERAAIKGDQFIIGLVSGPMASQSGALAGQLGIQERTENASHLSGGGGSPAFTIYWVIGFERTHSSAAAGVSVPTTWQGLCQGHKYDHKVAIVAPRQDTVEMSNEGLYDVLSASRALGGYSNAVQCLVRLRATQPKDALIRVGWLKSKPASLALTIPQSGTVAFPFYWIVNTHRAGSHSNRLQAWQNAGQKIFHRLCAFVVPLDGSADDGHNHCGMTGYPPPVYSAKTSTTFANDYGRLTKDAATITTLWTKDQKGGT